MKAKNKMLLSTVLGVFLFSSVSAQKNTTNDNQKQSLIDKDRTTYINQGGQIDLVPEFKTKSEKNDWHKVNEKAIKHSYNIQNHAKDNGLVKEERITKTKIIPNDSSFPEYINTGNKQVDQDNYRTAKELWIYNNKSKYEQLTKKSSNSMSADEKNERLMINNKN